MNYISNEIIFLALTAASVGFIHTLASPPHYLPFIVIGKAREWNIKKILFITFLCGLAHVLSSVILGLIGIATGIIIHEIEFFEGFRGTLTGWAFIIFGLCYMIWGIWKLYTKKPHSHPHFHSDGTKHSHKHNHDNIHKHIHKDTLTPWILFVIFVLGPCEHLILFLMYPAVQYSISGMVLIATVFAVTTIGTMITVVYLSSLGISFIKFDKVGKYMHVIAGAIILLSGLAITVLGHH